MNTDGHGLSRRGFVTGAVAAVGAAAATSEFDADFGSAMGAADAIRRKKVSSAELTQHVLRRIEQINPKLNAVVLRFSEESLERARQADAALAKGENWGSFHGVPITVKESYGMKGVPTTAGVPEFKDFRPSRNSAAVERMLGAGAIVVGKTNVPTMLADWQSYNPIYGTANNPWDVKRVPGGSTGGGAAALAAGLGYLTLGSDIGGSIRVPSHFCGVYGHKPTLELVSMRGHVPPAIDPAVRVFSDLSVGGPMARSAEDGPLETPKMARFCIYLQSFDSAELFPLPQSVKSLEVTENKPHKNHVFLFFSVEKRKDWEPSYPRRTSSRPSSAVSPSLK